MYEVVSEMEGVEEKVVEKYIKMFVELSEAEKKKKELREAFVQEFNIEPEVVTPKVARRAFELDGYLANIVDDVLEATNYGIADDDEYYTIELIAEFNEDNERCDWTLKTGYHLPYLKKCTGDYVYYVNIKILSYDDC